MKVQGHGQAKILTAAEIDKLFNEGFATDRDRALFGFCLYTGCRVSEACSLVTDDIYCSGQQIEARSMVTIRKGNTKGDEATRQIDTHPKLKALLENYVPGDRHVFPGRHRHNGSINPRSADEILKAACDRVGLEGVSTHSFRRTALTRMSNAGVPLRHIQEISGHKDLANASEVFGSVSRASQVGDRGSGFLSSFRKDCVDALNRINHTARSLHSITMQIKIFGDSSVLAPPPVENLMC